MGPDTGPTDVRGRPEGTQRGGGTQDHLPWGPGAKRVASPRMGAKIRPQATPEGGAYGWSWGGA